MCGHAESAHVRVRHIDPRILLELFNALHLPAPSAPRVLVYEVSTFLELVSVQDTTEFDVRTGLLELFLVFALPVRIVLVHLFVQFLQYTE